MLHQQPRRGLTVRSTSRPVLKRGDMGPQVADLQRRLGSLGLSPGLPDGIFDDRLARAVCAFRAEHPRLRQGVGYTDLLLHSMLEDRQAR